MAKTFKLSEIERLTRWVAERGRFPIQNQEALIEALGGHANKLEFHGREHRAEEAREIPDFYFPIVSASDFFTKLADMRGMRDETKDEEGLKPGKEVDPPSDLEPPEHPQPDLPKGPVPSAHGSAG